MTYPFFLLDAFQSRAAIWLANAFCCSEVSPISFDSVATVTTWLEWMFR